MTLIWLTILRAALSFVVLIGIARLIGKKFDSLADFTFGALAALLAVTWGSFTFTSTLIALVVWSVLYAALQWARTKSYVFRMAIHGKPSVVIEQGKVMEKNLSKSRLSVQDMMSMLREKNAFKLSDVEFGVLETDGKLSVMKKTDKEPVTPSTQGIPVETEASPRIVILDGHIMKTTLEGMGMTEGWLLGEIMKQGAKDYGDVFLAQADSNGNVYVDLYNDTITAQQVKAKPLLLASLKKIQADFESFALQTENASAKQLYEDASKNVSQIISTAHYFLRE